MLRECVYNGQTAFFHGWFQVAYPLEPAPFKGGHPAGQVVFPVAILELTDGSVVRACEREFTFKERRLPERLYKRESRNVPAYPQEGGGEL